MIELGKCGWYLTISNIGGHAIERTSCRFRKFELLTVILENPALISVKDGVW